MLVRNLNAPAGECFGLTHDEPRRAEIVILLARGAELRLCAECAEDCARLLRQDSFKLRRQDAEKQVQENGKTKNLY